MKTSTRRIASFPESASAELDNPSPVLLDPNAPGTPSSTLGSIKEPVAVAADDPSAALVDPPDTDAEARHQMISLAAYYRAEARGFASGHESEDWLAAEAEVDRVLALTDF